MDSSNFKLTNSAYVGILFFALLLAAIFMKETIFDFIIQSTGANQIEESRAATKETADLLLSLDKIKLDTSILSSTYFQSLSPLASFPIDALTLSNFGKANPFLGNFTVVSAPATSSVGALIYSNQRGANNGASQTSVSPTRR